MKDFILENLTNTEALSIPSILLNNVIALAAAFFIMFTYKVSHRGSLYSRKFNTALGSITIVTTMIMSIISNNVALSLGMVGALSIIRFRTAVKDVRDATFIFWAIAVGIGCGVSQYVLVALGSAVLLAFLLLVNKGFTADARLIVVQGETDTINKVETDVEEYFGGKAELTMRNVTKGGFELVYSVDSGDLRAAAKKNQMDISEKLIKFDGVNRVNVIEQKDDIAQ